MSEDWVKALLEDSNLPLNLRYEVSAKMRAAFQDAATKVHSLEECWRYASSLSHEVMFRGPKVQDLPKEVRVARVMSMATFLNYFAARSLPATFGSPRFPADLRRLPLSLNFYTKYIKPNFTDGPYGRAIWTTLAADTEGLTADDLIDELGVMHFAPGEHIVLLDYTLHSEALRVPTVLDAALQPWFQPKPPCEHPRSWNWASSRWGLIEAIHPPGTKAGDPSVRYLGELTKTDRPNLDRTTRFVLQDAAQIDQFFEGVVRQTLAHIELGPFLSGETDLLDISDREFEVFVGALYAREGYSTTVTRASKDGGFDVIAVLNRKSNEGLLIQAKHTAKRVGIKVLREIVGARFLADPKVGNYRLALATTGRFTKPVRDAVNQWSTLFVLRDYENLTRSIAHFRNVGTTDIYYSQIARAQDAT